MHELHSLQYKVSLQSVGKSIVVNSKIQNASSYIPRGARCLTLEHSLYKETRDVKDILQGEN
jgi:hypothetical protein